MLLELKQQLASAQNINGSLNEVGAATSNGLQVPNPAEVARLEAEIVKQVCMPRMSSRVEQKVARLLWFQSGCKSEQG